MDHQYQTLSSYNLILKQFSLTYAIIFSLSFAIFFIFVIKKGNCQFKIVIYNIIMSDKNQDAPEESEERFRIQKTSNAMVYKFKQQLIPAWRPVPSARNNLILYSILFLLFTGFGIAILVVNGNDTSYSQRYDNQCTILNTTCIITFTLTNTIKAPAYFYYGLTNFYQSSRLFLKWRSTDQLFQGKQISLDDAKDDCGIRATNGDMGWNISQTGQALNPNDVAFPCGFMAYSFFNDTFQIDGFPLSETDIAWPYDDDQYNNWDLSKQGIDLKDQHWLVWLRPSFTDNFYKLWGIVNRDMNPGTYTLRINNRYPLPFGEKKFQINGADVFGGTNLILGIAYIIGAGLCILLFIDFLYQHIKQNQWMNSRKQEVVNNADANIQMVNINRNGYTFVPTAY